MELVKEDEFTQLIQSCDECEDCDVGAMPPFGNLFGLSVLVSEKLAKDEEIVFNGGSHSELVKLAYKDFERLVKPEIIH